MEAAWQKIMDQNYNEGLSVGRNEGISIGEARAAAQYRAEIEALKAQLAQARK